MQRFFFKGRSKCSVFSPLTLTFLQAVDVLGVDAQQEALVVEHADEVMDVVGPVAAGVELLGQREEGFRVVREVVDVEHRLGVRKVVALQVRIQSCPWRSESRVQAVEYLTVCVCVCVCVYIYIYFFIYIFLYIFIYIYIYIVKPT